MKLKDKVAIVTGAGRGIGEGVALRFAAEGAKIVCVDVNMEDADGTVEAIKAKGSDAVAVKCDVSKAAETEAMAAAALDAFGTVDILVNNAGLIRDAQLKNMTEEMWDLVLNVNTKGPFLCCKAVTPVMVEKKYGKIVNLSSRAALGNFGQANYSAAKAGVIALTRTLALEMARHNINVNCIAPGYIDTPLMKGLPEKVIARILAGTPLGRAGKPADIAAAALFLVSDEASFITGQTLFVCGGRSLGSLSP
jgi:NAD(P)-dependent dehydrogenase (short-subunit alcohol dehydrogenase family)